MMRIEMQIAGGRRLGALRVVCVVGLVWVACLSFVGAAASADVGWTVRPVSEPSSFNAADSVACATEEQCDRYQVLILNAGDEASNGKVTLTDVLPAGITTQESHGLSIESGKGPGGHTWLCNGGAGHATVICELEEPIAPGHFAPYIDITVTAPTESMSGVLTDTVSVDGGGLAAGSAIVGTPISRAAAFEVSEFAVQPGGAGGISPLQAGGHPWELTTSFGVPSQDAPPKGGIGGRHLFAPPRNFKQVSVELPVGLLGDPHATAQCPEYVLREGRCPEDTKVGVFGVLQAGLFEGEFSYTGEPGVPSCCTAVYNVVPAAGYPAEFGLTFAKSVPLVMYANVVHTGTGYRLRVTIPGAPVALETLGFDLTFFGEPGLVNGTKSEAAFLDNPMDCSAEAEGLWSGVGGTAKGLSSRIEMEPWGEQGDLQTRETVVYSSLTGCSSVSFRPSLSLTPSAPGPGAEQEGSTKADEPSAYNVDLKFPQTSGFGELSTADLRDASVTLPTGVSVSPSAATGLVGCKERGGEGIDLPSADIGPRGQDLGDPEATELGEGHAGPGGNNSPYDDGFYHEVAGHCPSASTLGTVEACTPLLANRPNSEGKVEESEQACEEHAGIAPLQGHLYLAQPLCGSEGQPACKESTDPSQDSAENGELFRDYIEVEGAGVIVKLPGTISANPVTGQLTNTFLENPQVALGELKLHLKGGPQAPVANPLTCGTYTASSLLEPWSHDRQDPTQGTANATPSSSFAITGCPTTTPFNPTFVAGTTEPVAGGSSPFVLAFSREDGEQDLAGVSVALPVGMAGKIASTPRCPEPQASEGTCGPESQIGTTSVLAGPGSQPYPETGRVYLTGPYGGGPFGLSIVVPTKAGPFNLGNEVVRAAIHINPTTAQATITTNPLPQSKDGIPLRLRRVTTETNEKFIVNPTSCGQQHVTATITAAQGASANVSAPFQTTGCTNLPFKPSFSETSNARTSKMDGASLTVQIKQNAGEANIAKTDVQLPVQLPSRLTTLQKACLQAQFEADPAGCPEASDIGTATVSTPLLEHPLTGPAYLVSHGGAAFPDIEFVLQSEGITIILDGKTDIKKGITYSSFETVPDSPISSFTASFPEGPHSVLAQYGSLCTPTQTVTTTRHITKRIHGHKRRVTLKTTKTIPAPLISPTTLVAQNGATIKQNTPITVANCPTPKATAKVAHKKTHGKKKS